MRRPRFPRAAAARTAAGSSALLAGLALLTGCGIRGTAVPVDAGGAPSRATCVVRPGAQSSAASGSAALSVQLLCTSQLLPVTRNVPLPDGDDAVKVARALLDELRRQPSPAEDDAGFSTDVPGNLSVAGPGRGDPSATLRLSTAPDDLPPPALAQLVCTYAGTAAADGKSSVVLGGPGTEKPKRYTCTDELRTRPESVQGTGVTVS
ncbi:hypothetical protein AB0K09_11235 [Streptomyces sp. NPDC049577]|uniref:hypothetical protein n=1 Tax=Streptomyces sp. NPDC049577 TaxID=3155153 RepID=UPI003418FD54